MASKTRKQVEVSAHERTVKSGKTVQVQHHFRHALVKQGKVVGFIKADKFRGARLVRIEPSKALKKGLAELQRSPAWKKSKF